ncbi:signal peptidase I [Desulfofustis limnaeus]|uniref:Signal peptidase I n=1 Tax=Desulfofustis limnaeus TaxID=2740163 RepID=A0ABN6M6I2_9BACT|nr:signal peptidase I [Desulfofustis limnaeus]BDD87669.1 hypothetical protein DPPLL_20340 [Desulfofustis limnaeus]
MDNTPAELKLSGSALSALMQDVLARGASFRFQAKGGSMSPFVKDQDILTLTKVNPATIRVGDIAAVRPPNRDTLIVHRVIRVSNHAFLLKGDNNPTPDGIFSPDAIIGIVDTIERKGRSAPFCSKPACLIIAVLSRSGLLNSCLLPLIRKVKSSMIKPSPSSQIAL